MSLNICEIFNSIQGESSYAGLPCVFVRLTGCNLRCSYCDTAYAYDNGMDMTEDAVIEKVMQAGVRLVEITGGEPLLQGEVHGFMKNLLDAGCKVLVETNGSVSIADIDTRAIVILDFKTPGSGMSDKMDLENLKRIKPSDEVKFVLTGRHDYDWSKKIICKYNLTNKCHILISPAYGILKPDNLAVWMMEDKLQARFNLQLHKYIFGPERRGV
jgi:7-carboxy-7-deazaguanine synthase